MKHINESITGIEFNDKGIINFMKGKCKAKDFKRWNYGN